MIDSGELPAFRVRGAIRIRKAVIDDLMMQDTGERKSVHPDEEKEIEEA